MVCTLFTNVKVLLYYFGESCICLFLFDLSYSDCFAYRFAIMNILFCFGCYNGAVSRVVGCVESVCFVTVYFYVKHVIISKIIAIFLA